MKWGSLGWLAVAAALAIGGMFGEAEAASCKQGVKSKKSNVPVKVKFVNKSGEYRGVFIHIIDVNQSSGRNEGRRHLGGLEHQPVVAVPQHNALAGAVVDGDDGKLVGAFARHNMGQVDAAARQLAPDAGAIVVGADGADIGGTKAQRGTSCQGRGHLPAARDGVAADA